MLEKFFKQDISSSSEKRISAIHLNKRVVIFLFCLIVSSFFWLMLALSKEYTIEIYFPVQYINLPPDKVIANNLSETIDIELKSNGFNLLFYKLKEKKETVLIDFKDAKRMPPKNNYFLLTNLRIDKIKNQFSENFKILKIYPDTIFLNFNKKISKRVPVIANLTFTLDKQYQQCDSIRLNPAFVIISGAADNIDKINHLVTETVNLKDVSDSISLKLAILKTPTLNLVELSQLSVQANVNISKFTEGNMELPIEIENLPKGYSLKLFPDKVSIKYNVAFENFEKINAMQFNASVNYLKIEPTSNKLKILLLKYPTDVRAIKINPEKVEYILRH